MRDQALNHHVLQCMEIIGGNRALRQTIAAPGLEIWIDSRPLELGAGGGDIHYVSTCAGGYVTRLALADIAGHGKSADGLAIVLRDLMRKYINTLDPTRFARTLNRELAAATESECFATALLLTYFAPTRHLIICNAGHVHPLRYSARRCALAEPRSEICRRLPFAQSFAHATISRGLPTCRWAFWIAFNTSSSRSRLRRATWCSYAPMRSRRAWTMRAKCWASRPVDSRRDARHRRSD